MKKLVILAIGLVLISCAPKPPRGTWQARKGQTMFCFIWEGQMLCSVAPINKSKEEVTPCL